MKDISKIGNYELIEHFINAICDNHYNPTNDSYNKSGFTLEELEAEVIDRMDNSPTDDDLPW